MRIDISKLVKRPITKGIQQMIGNKFGMLLVLSYEGAYYAPFSSGRYYVKCQCDCGKIKIKSANDVRYGKTKSCGCYGAECSKRKMLKHGDSFTKEYEAWQGMKKRCYNKKSDSYKNYGAVGIQVCLGYRGDNGYLNFKKDLGAAPTPHHSMDRKDSSKNYSCGKCEECVTNNWEMNCRWATYEVQANNTNRNKYIFVMDEKLTYSQAERKLGFKYGLINSRIGRGWSIEDAISIIPSLGNKTRHNKNKI